MPFASIVSAVEEGLYRPSMNLRLKELEQERDRLQAAMAAAPEPTTSIVIHPNLAEVYRKRVAELEFMYDKSIAGQDRIEQLLNEIRAGDAAPEAGVTTG